LPLGAQQFGFATGALGLRQRLGDALPRAAKNCGSSAFWATFTAMNRKMAKLMLEKISLLHGMWWSPCGSSISAASAAAGSTAINVKSTPRFIGAYLA
jgi:hypothetical protein